MFNVGEATNDLAQQRLCEAFEAGQKINVSDLVLEITERLADPIICGAPPEEQPCLIAHVVAELDRFGKERREAGLGAQVR
jgi:hypothetical protein